VASIVPGALLAVPTFGTGEDLTISEGLVMCMIAMLADATKSFASERLLQAAKRARPDQTGEVSSVPTPDELSWVNSGTAFAVMLPWWGASDEFGSTIRFIADAPGWATTAIGIPTVLSPCYNLLYFHLVQVSSGLTLVLISTVRRILVMGGSAALVDHVSSPTNWAGMILVVCASVWYGDVKLSERSATRAQKADTEQVSKSTGSSPSGSISPKRISTTPCTALAMV